MTATDPRLQRLLGGDGLAALRQRLRRHFEREAPDAPRGTLRLGSLDAFEREALARLSGRPPRDARSMQLDLAAIDQSLRDAGIADSLRESLAQLDGPIRHLASMRAEESGRWSAVVAACPHPALARCLQSPAVLGVLKRLARQDSGAAMRLLDRADAVLRRLPAAGVGRSQLAADTLGNAHALDPGQPTATLVLAAWREIEHGSPQAADMDDEPAADERSRDIWARAGVLVNELARPALLLNVPVAAGEASAFPAGEPAYLSLRRLLRTPPRWAVADTAVFVCENPNLVAIAADRLGARCVPLVCTDGMPAAAQRTLLDQLAAAGARLQYHGDFDWPGLRIANHVMRVWKAAPWRFGAVDYVDAVTAMPSARHALDDTLVDASWDAALTTAMRHHRWAIAEEAVAAPLLADLRRT